MTAPFPSSGKTAAWTANMAPPKPRGSSRRRWASSPPGDCSMPPSPRDRESDPDRGGNDPSRRVLAAREGSSTPNSQIHFPDSRVDHEFTSWFGRGLLRIRDDDQLDRRRALLGLGGL